MTSHKLLFFLFSPGFCASCSGQASSPFAPEAGTCSGASYGVTAGYQYGYNAITGFGMQPGSQVAVTPSPLGDLILASTGANKGSYRFSKAAD
jgi:hypothetical protein